jgi:hypothetical protein
MRVLHTNLVCDFPYRTLVRERVAQFFEKPKACRPFSPTLTCLVALGLLLASFGLNAQPGCDNVVNGGIVEANEFGCPNPTWDPSPITSVTLPTGGTGTLEFIWMMTTDDPMMPFAVWSPIPGSTSASYDPGPISVTTHYRRCSRRSGCNDYLGESNIVTKEAICCDNVTDGGEIAADQVLCAVPADPAAITNVVLPTGGSNVLEYQWVSSITGTPYSPSNPDWILIGGATSMDYDPGMLAQTTYFIRLSRRYGCLDFDGVSNMVTVTIGGQINLALTSTAETCPNANDGTATISNIMGGITPYTYIWSDPASQTVATATGLSPGNYSVTVTDNTGCSTSGTVTVDSASSIQLDFSHTDATCGDSQDGTATVTVSGGTAPFSFSWSDPATQSTQTALGLSPGNYFVTVTDANGCTAIGNEVVEAPMPVVLTTTATDVTCFGANDGTASASIQGGDPSFYNFLWNDPASSTSPNITGLAPGVYMLMVTDTNGCMVSADVTIAEPSALVLAMSSQAATCFDGNDGQASVVATGGTGAYQYTWSATGSPNQPSIGNLAPGTYSVTVTDANGCTASNSTVVDAPEKVTPVIASSNVLCAGDTNGTASASVTGGNAPYTFLWSNGATSASLANLAPGSYGLTVTDATGCTGTATTTISEPPALTLAINKTDVICEDDFTGTATAVPAGGVAPYSYLWGGGQITVSVGFLGVGSYIVTVTDANGCQISGTTTIVYTSTLASTVSSASASCYDSSDGSATATGLDGNAPYTYLWSNGGTTSTINGLAAGSYQVTLTDNDGCSVFNSVSVGAPPQLLCQAVVISPITVYQGSDGGAVAGATGGVWPYTYLWDNGVANDTVTTLNPGPHTATITDANGCTCLAQVTLISPSKVGNFVWNDLNQNGIQEPGEPGVGGVTVQLSGTTNAGQQPVNMTTVTDSLGQYAFDGLVPGFYKLKLFPQANQTFSYQNIGNDALDSDFNPADSSTISFPLPQGFFDAKWDAGLVVLDEKVNIGDLVWFDQNHNGIQDPFESGISGVNVRLFSMPSNTLVAVTTTNLLGKYLFQDVMPGTYVVEFNPNSLPNDYIFSPKDQGNDDSKDSDPFTNTGRTAQFQVFPFTLDNLTIDAGAYKECDNVTDGGLVGYDEDLCGTGADPSEIVNLALPTGGFGNLEYLWLSSNIPVYNGPGDPNWLPIPNSNSANYNPGPIGQTTYYIRCARRQGCPDYPGESNIVAKKITAYPLTQIIDEPYELCKLENGRFEAAIAGGGAAYFWQFGSDAVPQTASTRVVNAVYWSTAGTKTATLTVTRFGCSFSVTTNVLVDPCGIFNLVGIGDLGASVLGDAVQLEWKTIGDLSNAIMYVECSEDGENFNTITVMSSGNASEGETFSYLDTRPHFGQNIYRVKFEKMTGDKAEGYSATAKVNYQPDWAGRVVVYPNPSPNEVFVELLNPDSNPASITLMTPFGKTLERIELPAYTDKAPIELAAYPEGIYLIVVKQDGYREQIVKVVKTH